MVRDNLLKLLKREDLMDNDYELFSDAGKNLGIYKNITRGDIMDIKDSILNKYNNDYSYPKNYRINPDEELIHLITDEIFNKLDLWDD
jgi:hypothetical protein